jgi:hypothetical protein
MPREGVMGYGIRIGNAVSEAEWGGPDDEPHASWSVECV